MTYSNFLSPTQENNFMRMLNGWDIVQMIMSFILELKRYKENLCKPIGLVENWTFVI